MLLHVGSCTADFAENRGLGGKRVVGHEKL
jgi:hypothetical protein